MIDLASPFSIRRRLVHVGARLAGALARGAGGPRRRLRPHRHRQRGPDRPHRGGDPRRDRSARLADGRQLKGAANLGIRPTFDPPKELLEPYFFDFAGDLYGQTIEVELIEFLRPEAKFDSLDALKVQMALDCDRARLLLAR